MQSRNFTAARFPRPSVLAIALTFLLLAACAGSSSRSTAAGRGTAEALGDGLQGAPIRLTRTPEGDEIATLEDRRSLGKGRLLELLSHPDAPVRARAARALGRFAWPDFGSVITDALCRAMEDPDPQVRMEAAFALGNRADPASGGVLMSYRNDPDPALRARVVEAASKLGMPSLHADLVLALRDSDLGVRIEAAVGTARWSSADPGAEVVDRALIDALRPYTLSARPDRSPAEGEVEAQLCWRLLYALSRRGSAMGRGAFLEYASSDAPLEQLFAVRGLGRLEGDAEAVALLSRILSGEVASRRDWRVAFEAATALGKLGSADGLKALVEAVEHPSPHVRAAAMTALGTIGAEPKEVVPKLRRGLLDLSTSVRGAALASVVGILPLDEALRALDLPSRDEDPFVRAGAVVAAARRTEPEVLPLLRRLAEDPSPLVGARAVEALAGRVDPTLRPLLRGFLEHADNGLRLAAALALGETPDASDVAALETAFSSTTGDLSAEVAFQCLHALAAIGGERARRVHERALLDPRPHVRRVARKHLVETFGAQVPASEPAPLDLPGTVPLPGRDFPAWTRNPLVEIRTNRGAMVFELLPAEAPLHVHSFTKLVEAGHYDGLVFHRVVPDFVIQGGDYRGDGNGAQPARGEALRQEFTPRKYVRGSLGMPRNEDPDSGGSQIFVTHRPTPHLDGQYTLFGELRAGGEVLDRIEAGDHIQGVRLLD